MAPGGGVAGGGGGGGVAAADTFIVTLLEVAPPEFVQVIVKVTSVVSGTVVLESATFGATFPIETIEQLVALLEFHVSRAVEPYGTVTEVAPLTKKFTIGGVTAAGKTVTG